ncbi:MAG: hypothetical protein CMK09_08970 [Ponticaulis sp.]|nr:hypothetical protein [Ponticaulis sp.]
MLRRILLPGFVSVIALGSALTYAASAENKAPATGSFAVTTLNEEARESIGDRSEFVMAYRRLTETQYRNTIADVFGETIKVEGRFEPEMRDDGLQAVGNAQLSVTTSGLEQYYSLARSISSQVIAEGEDQLGCAVDAPKAEARACAEAFLTETARRLYSRPMDKFERDMVMAIWDAAAEDKDEFGQAFQMSLVSVLVSPEFLFRREIAEKVDDGEYRLDGYSKAARLSYYLWDRAPDEELLTAAESGVLHTQDGIDEQVERLLSSPKIAHGVRAFFSDMLHFEDFDTVTKDAQTYPKFSQAVADSAREETLRFLQLHLIDNESDYRDIFTTKKTVINRSLAAVYNVPYASKADWATYEFDEDSQRSGILTQVTFASLFSHPGSSSPTLRGLHLAEIFQCTKIPDPPADVDFSKVQALESGTVRERLDAHRTDPTCASCHVLMDPAGLALENFDGIGQFRAQENGEAIDVSANIFGEELSGAPGVGQYLHDNPQISSCLVQKAYNYGVGRPTDYSKAKFLQAKEADFAEEGYQFKPLLRSILTDPQFYEVIVPNGLEARSTSASLETETNARGGQQ